MLDGRRRAGRLESTIYIEALSGGEGGGGLEEGYFSQAPACEYRDIDDTLLM